MDGSKILVKSTTTKQIAYLAVKSSVDFETAMARAALQFLTWSNVGSAKSSRKPPIRWGILRGSSSVFVGDKLISVFPQNVKAGSGEKISPAKQYAGKPTVMTAVWNTEYATIMHEWEGGWGDFTKQDGDAGAKWLEEHLKADKDDLMEMVTVEFKKEFGI